MLPESKQKDICDKIGNALLQAKNIQKYTPNDFFAYIDSEIQKDVKVMNDMERENEDAKIRIKNGYLPDYLNMSFIYVLHKEHIKALEELKEIEVQGKDGMRIVELQNLYSESSSEPKHGLIELLPEELKKNEVVGIFQRAIDANLIVHTPKGLKWKDTKQLLAYFAVRLSELFDLSKRVDKDGNKTTSWKPFENLFGETDLKGAKQNWMRSNTKFEPTGFKKVDALL